MSERGMTKTILLSELVEAIRADSSKTDLNVGKAGGNVAEWLGKIADHVSLHRYADHTLDCESRIMVWKEPNIPQRRPCTCGLAEILDRLENA